MRIVIAIPSKKRAGKCKIFQRIIPDIKKSWNVEIFLFVESDDAEDYRRAYGNSASIVILPESSRGIGYARNYIQNYFPQDIIVMIDDDTEEYRGRLKGELTTGGFIKLRKCDPVEAIKYLILKSLESGFGGMSFTPQNWSMKEGCRGLAWNTVVLTPSLLRKGIEYDVLAAPFEDYDFTAQAISRGVTPYICIEYAFNTSIKIGDLPGGLQCFDRVELNKNAIAYLQEKWGECVKTVENKKSLREEIRFNWRRVVARQQSSLKDTTEKIGQLSII